MTNLHYFYGCSMTAGDELSDGTPKYPFKMEVTLDYFKTRAGILDTSLKLEEYYNENKNLAYPAILHRKYNIDTVNVAENGMSLRHIITKITALVANSKDTIDHIFLQVPVLGREYYVNSQYETSFQFANEVIPNNQDLDNYRKAKLMSHSDVQESIADITDLVLLDGFLQSKNITFTIIDINKSLDIRFRILIPTQHLYLCKFRKELHILNVHVPNDWCFPSGHMNRNGHEKFADFIKTKVIDKL